MCELDYVFGHVSGRGRPRIEPSYQMKSDQLSDGVFYGPWRGNEEGRTTRAIEYKHILSGLHNQHIQRRKQSSNVFGTWTFQ